MGIRISVITAVYNAAPTLEQALESVHAQTWSDVEHIVVDGGSTDGSVAMLMQHRPKIAKLISEPDKGLYDALNKGIRHASGDIIGFLHSDDQFATRDALAKVAAAFNDPEVGAAYGDLVYVKRHAPEQVVRYWRAGAFKRALLTTGWMPPHPTFYVRRELYARYGVFDTKYKISADYDSILRLLWHGRIAACYIPEVLVRMRTGGVSNRSLLGLIRKSGEDYMAMRANGIGGLQTVLRKNFAKLPQFFDRSAFQRI
jgi:glycosyltransferase involved in cell wall biosynthesis